MDWTEDWTGLATVTVTVTVILPQGTATRNQDLGSHITDVRLSTASSCATIGATVRAASCVASPWVTSTSPIGRAAFPLLPFAMSLVVTVSFACFCMFDIFFTRRFRKRNATGKGKGRDDD